VIPSVWQMAVTTLSLLGFCVLGVSGVIDDVIIYNDALVAIDYGGKSFAVGGIIFCGYDQFSDVPRGHVLSHEYGHHLQERQLGILYLPVVIIPSVIHRVLWRHNLDHPEPYCEQWADELGGVGQ
jgi:hypothetical protein